MLRAALVGLFTLSGCDRFFGLTGPPAIAADDAPPGTDALADGVAAACTFSGPPLPVAAAVHWYPTAALTAAVRGTATGQTQYASSGTETIDTVDNGGYQPALPSAELAISQPTVAADGTYLVAVRNPGPAGTFVITEMRGGTAPTPPFGPTRQLHLRETMGGSDVIPGIGDQLSPPTSTSPARMILRPDSTQIEEFAKDGAPDTWVRGATMDAMSLGVQSIDAATLSSDGLALTLVGPPSAGAIPAILRATRASVDDEFGPATPIYIVAGLGLSGAYTSADCRTLFFVQAGMLHVVR